MFFISTIYILMALVIFWSYCGYLVFLYLFSLFSGEEQESDCGSVVSVRRVHVVVPCYNEREMIEAKVCNLAKTTFPVEALRVTFVDGQSTDGTRELLCAILAGRPGWEVVTSPTPGKIGQLNYALTLDPEAEFILCTDVDAILLSDTIENLYRRLESDPETGVVGAYIMPKNSLELDEHFWSDQNNVRFFESRVYSSSIVVAPCYMFRRCVLDAFPADCVADDVFVAFKANSDGWRVRQVQDAYGFEIRGPKTLPQYLRHKFRKVHAYIIELLRFFYRFPYFPGFFKIIYASKVCQVLLCPWLLVYFALGTLSLILSGGFLREMALLSCVFLLLSFLLASSIMKYGRGKFVGPEGSPYRKRMLLLSFAINNFIMLWAGACFPFHRQDSRYRKCNEKSM